MSGSEEDVPLASRIPKVRTLLEMCATVNIEQELRSFGSAEMQLCEGDKSKRRMDVRVRFMELKPTFCDSQEIKLKGPALVICLKITAHTCQWSQVELFSVVACLC